MKILFCDIDGVLNRCGKSIKHFEEDKILLLKSIVEQTGCEIVLSSTWRKSEHNLKAVKKLCKNRLGKELFGVTPIGDTLIDGLWRAVPRGEEIGQWLSENPVDSFEQALNDSEINYVILDDDSDMGELSDKLALTKSFVGLTPEIAQEVIRRMNLTFDNKII